MIIHKERGWSGRPAEGALRSLRILSAGVLPEKDHVLNWIPDMWGVGIVWSGTGFYQSGSSDMQMSLEAPFYFFIWPGEWFHYGPTSTWEESFLCFSGERVAEWQACGWLRQDPRVYPLNGPLDPVW